MQKLLNITLISLALMSIQAINCADRYDINSIQEVTRRLLSDALNDKVSALREILSGDLRAEDGKILDTLRGGLISADRTDLLI